MATGFGLLPVRKIDGGQVRVRPYSVLSTYATSLKIGDAVVLAATGALGGPNADLPAIEVAAAGATILGAVVGFAPDATLPFTGNFNPASNARVVYVCDDPDAVFQVQEDAVGGAVSAANIGQMFNADLIIAAGSSYTGMSGHMLDSSTAVATTANLKIVGVLRDESNVAAQTAGAILEVIILEHALRTADSIA